MPVIRHSCLGLAYHLQTSIVRCMPCRRPIGPKVERGMEVAVASCLHMIGKKSGTNGTAIFFLASFAGRSMLVTDVYLLCYMLRRSPSETRYHSHTAATHFARLMFLLELSTIQGCLRRSRGYGRNCASRMRLGCQAKRRGQGLRIEHTARPYH
jgi:hypothetical protein